MFDSQLLKKPAEGLAKIDSIPDSVRRSEALLEFLNTTLQTGPGVDTREHSYDVLLARPAALRKLLTNNPKADDMLAALLSKGEYSNLKLDNRLKLSAFDHTLGGELHSAEFALKPADPNLGPDAQALKEEFIRDETHRKFGAPLVLFPLSAYPMTMEALASRLRDNPDQIRSLHLRFLNHWGHTGLDQQALEIFKSLAFTREARSRAVTVAQLVGDVNRLNDFFDEEEEQNARLEGALSYVLRGADDACFFECLKLVVDKSLTEAAQDKLAMGLAQKGDMRAADALIASASRDGPRPTRFAGYDDFYLPGSHEALIQLLKDKALPYLRVMAAHSSDFFWQYRYAFADLGQEDEVKFLKALANREDVLSDQEWRKEVRSTIASIEARLGRSDILADAALLPAKGQSRAEVPPLIEETAWNAGLAFVNRVIGKELDCELGDDDNVFDFDGYPTVVQRSDHKISFSFSFRSTASGLIPNHKGVHEKFVGSSLDIAVLTVYDLQHPLTKADYDYQAKVLEHGGLKISGQTSSSIGEKDGLGFFLQTRSKIVPAIGPLAENN